MQQLTVKELAKHIVALLKEHPECADKKIAISDDNEGNSYHGLFYAFTFDEKDIKNVIEYSNGISDSETEEPSELVILG